MLFCEPNLFGILTNISLVLTSLALQCLQKAQQSCTTLILIQEIECDAYFKQVMVPEETVENGNNNNN